MEEEKPSLFKHEDIQQKLDKKLGPEYISKRIGFGSSRVAYIEGWRAINLANQIFGYNGWSTEVKNIIVDFLDERQGKFNVGCTAIVRVSLADGTYREDIGYGAVENERRKAAAFERAKKSAVTDALKRSLRGFGNALGNCLYDKDFLSRIDKIKFDPPDFDEGNLFRPSDEISENSRAATLDTENGPSLKKQKISTNATTYKQQAPQKSVHPDVNATKKNTETTNDSLKSKRNENSRPSERTATKSENEDLLDDSFMFSDDFQDEELINIGLMSKNIPSDPTGEERNVEPNIRDDPGNATFVTARAADMYRNPNNIPENEIFDPQYKTQSVKLTIDQNSSKHIPVSVLKEKGLSNVSRESIYSKFAAKGKQLATENTEEEVNVNTTERKTILNENIEEDRQSDKTTDNDKINESSNYNNTSQQTDSNEKTQENNTKSAQSTQLNSQVGSQKSPAFAPPVSVVHPNSSSTLLTNTIKSSRREVGRPKIHNFPTKKLQDQA
ncbi:DNA repair and recombination protein RAD52 [Nakaseomyces bracarensis]|uniref:DNA repair and recombination protein RAD52 n=1 Tax=Nakaseomyces bracarensis TaxID=273131 RepID=A0ABR4P0G4_9SACH